MKEKEIKKRIEQWLAGELSDTEQIEFLEQIADYPEYQEIVEIHKKLRSVKNYVPTIPQEQLNQMRQEIVRTLRLQKNDSLKSDPGSLLERIRNLFVRPEMAVAALTLIIGFFMGRNFPVSGESMTGQVVRQINMLASQNTQLTDVKNSPYTYSNISFREVDQGRIELSFDVSTHLDMVKSKDDPVVREVIAQALLNPSNVGSELKAISFSESIVDQRVKQALIFSMRNAPILAVRQKAEEKLLEYNHDPEIRQAFIDLLRKEESVQMRLLALDYLIENQVSPDSIRALMENKYLQNSPAVMFRARKYLENTF